MESDALSRYDPIGDAAREILESLHVNGELGSDDVAEIIRGHLNKPPAMEIHGDSNGAYEILSKHWAIQHLVGSIEHTLDQFGGKNYATFEMSGSPRGPVCVTIQRKHGKSPAQVQGELMDMLRTVLDSGASSEEHVSAVDKAAKWLYEHDVLVAEKERVVNEYRDAQESVRRPSRRWWASWFGRRCN